jgi:voltage-gated potassium channel
VPGSWPRGLIIGLVLLLGWTFVGTIGFSALEGWPWVDSFYMTITTLSTVGYGEIHPLSRMGRLFASFLIVGGLGTALYTLTRVAQVLLESELLGGIARRRMQRQLDGLENHFVLCGFGRFARPVAEELAHKNLPFCVIEKDPAAEAHLIDRGYRHLIGDATTDEALQAAGIERAQAVLALLPSDADNLYVTVAAKAMNPKLRVIARAGDEGGERKLGRGGATVVVTPYRLSGQRIVQAATSATVLEFMDYVSDRHYLEMNLGEAVVGARSPLAGSTIAGARLHSEHRVIVVALKRQNTMLFNPQPEEELRPGDILVIMGHADQLRKTTRLLEDGRG